MGHDNENQLFRPSREILKRCDVLDISGKISLVSGASWHTISCNTETTEGLTTFQPTKMAKHRPPSYESLGFAGNLRDVNPPFTPQQLEVLLVPSDHWGPRHPLNKLKARVKRMATAGYRQNPAKQRLQSRLYAAARRSEVSGQPVRYRDMEGKWQEFMPGDDPRPSRKAGTFRTRNLTIPALTLESLHHWAGVFARDKRQSTYELWLRLGRALAEEHPHHPNIVTALEKLLVDVAKTHKRQKGLGHYDPPSVDVSFAGALHALDVRTPTPSELETTEWLNQNGYRKSRVPSYMPADRNYYANQERNVWVERTTGKVYAWALESDLETGTSWRTTGILFVPRTRCEQLEEEPERLKQNRAQTKVKSMNDIYYDTPEYRETDD